MYKEAYAPTKNPELAKQRQKQVLEKMIKNKYLTQEEADKIIERRIKYELFRKYTLVYFWRFI